tara:strand:- start:505 stop:1224 length:720 start_codon:yes stop_codon:yes gene_type:complete
MLAQGFKKKDKVLPLKEVPTQDALAVACAAYRIRKGYQKNTQRFSEDKPTQHSNKEMVKFYFNALQDSYVDTDFIMFRPTKEDYAAGAEIQKWMKRYVMLGLGDLDDFKQDMIGSIANTTVPMNNLGRVAFLPEFVVRDKHENRLTKEIRIEYRDSQYLGKEQDVVEGVVKILDKRYSERWESYNYTAVMDGNLVSFMNKFDHKVGDMKRIKAKVKMQTQNKFFGANETRLNYVKIYKV